MKDDVSTLDNFGFDFTCYICHIFRIARISRLFVLSSLSHTFVTPSDVAELLYSEC